VGSWSIHEEKDAASMKETQMNPERLASELNRLYREVEQRVQPLVAIHAARLQCRKGCRQCCVDDLSVFAVEAENIRRHHSDLLASGHPHPEGACAFLDQAGACRVYENRPYVCRTQGLPLRWIEQYPDGTTAELRDICPLNDQGQPVETLPETQCWSIGPFEGTLARLQARVDGGAPYRVSLRSLFQEKRSA
jgi:hypothetical protein